MPTITNDEELFKILGEDTGIQNQIAAHETDRVRSTATGDALATAAVGSTGIPFKEYRQSELIRMAEVLLKRITTNIETYLNSYTPSPNSPWKRRASGILDALKLEDMITPKITYKKGQIGEIALVFNNNAICQNIIASDPHNSFVPVLMDQGWHLKNVVRRVPRFTDFEGTGYITNAINEFNAMYPGAHATFVYDGYRL